MTNEEFIQSIALPGEKWALACGCDSRYAISTFGRVASLSFLYYQRDYPCYRKQRIKSQSLHSGYYSTNIIKDGKERLYQVHRLVAETFIPNPNNLPCVNHKDEDKTNNHVENLEWCTYQYNLRYGEQYRVRALKALKDLSARKPVVQLAIDGTYINTHRSIYYAALTTGIEKPSIRQNLCGKRKTAGGFRWVYLSDYESQVSMSKNYTIPKNDPYAVSGEMSCKVPE